MGRKRTDSKHLQDGVIDEQPSQYNRVYYPNAEDIRNMFKKVVTQECNFAAEGNGNLISLGSILKMNPSDLAYSCLP